jgi:hypothetical protein
MRQNMRRSRIPQLFRTPKKLLLGETSGGYYDTKQLFANHSVQVVVPWSALSGVEEAGVRKVRRNSEALAASTSLETIANAFDLRYILAIINSDYMRSYLWTNKMRGTRAKRIYPDVWKEMPVKVVSAATQAIIAALVDDMQTMYATLSTMQTEQDVYQSWQQQGRITGYVKDHLAMGRIVPLGALDKTRKNPYVVTGDQVLLYGTTGIQVTDPANRPLLDYFCWYCNEVASHLRGYPWEQLRQQIPIPGTVEQVSALLADVEATRQARVSQEEAIKAKREEIEQAVRTAYESGCDEELWTQIDALRDGPTISSHDVEEDDEDI